MPAEIAITPRGRFSLAASAAFVAGWPPAARDAAPADGVLRLALGPDGRTGPLGVALRQGDDGVVTGTATGPGDPGEVTARVARMLSLDIDGRGYAAVGRRDPVVGATLRRLDHLRPVVFASPFEAGVWAILSQRTRMAQARATWARIVDAHGVVVDAGGHPMRAFPDPSDLTDLAPGPGVTPVRAERLRELARAAAGGRLDADHLRALPADEAMAELRELPGIGPFSAQLVLIRGAGAPDVLPTVEPRLRAAVGWAYDLPGPADDTTLTRVSGPWAPFRSWVALLMRAGHGDAVSRGGRPPGGSR